MKQLAFLGALSVGMFLALATLTGCGEESTVAAVNGPPARPLQTGQTTCYDTNGNSVGCAGTGQDGALQAGVPRRYIDNGDGTITDVSTGLMWEKKSRDGSLHGWTNPHTWSDAFAFIAQLNNVRFAGRTDWRLPNVNELQTLIDYSQPTSPAIDSSFNTACVPGCTVLTCSCTQPSDHWSSTTFASNPQVAWAVEFNAGHALFDGKNGDIYVRAVRGGL